MGKSRSEVSNSRLLPHRSTHRSSKPAAFAHCFAYATPPHAPQRDATLCLTPQHLNKTFLHNQSSSKMMKLHAPIHRPDMFHSKRCLPCARSRGKPSNPNKQNTQVGMSQPTHLSTSTESTSCNIHSYPSNSTKPYCHQRWHLHDLQRSSKPKHLPRSTQISTTSISLTHESHLQKSFQPYQ